MLELLLALSAEAILLYDENEIILRANTAAERLFGCQPGELDGHPLTDLLPERRHNRRHVLTQTFVLPASQTIQLDEIRQGSGRKKNGAEFAFEARVGLSLLDGRVVGAAALRDLGDRFGESKNARLFASLLDQVGNLVLVANSAAEVIYVSPSVSKILGYEPSELMGRGWWDLERRSRGNIDGDIEYIKNAAAGKTQPDAQAYEHRLLHKDGSWRDMLLYDAKGPDDLIIGIGTDITNLKQATEALEASQQRYRLAISAAGAVPYTIDLKTMTYSSMGMEIENITGYLRSELTPLMFQGLIVDSQMRGIHEGLTFAQALKASEATTGENIWLADYLIQTSTGEHTWLSDSAVIIPGPDGRRALCIGILQDISERKQAELHLQNERDTSRQIMENMSVGLTISARDNRIEYANPAFAAMTGYTPAEIVGKRANEMTSPADLPVLSEAERQRKKGEISTYIVRVRHKDGSEHPCQVTGFPRIQEGRVIGSFAVFKDICERLTLEADLAAYRETVQALAEIGATVPTLQDRLNALLELGMQRFGLPSATLTSADGERELPLAARGLVAVRPALNPFNSLSAPVAGGKLLAFFSPEDRAAPFDQASQDLLQLMALWAAAQLSRPE